jgi:5'-deoxynucleotidase YfbR-like HD superfamily hydrolase
MSKYVGGDPLEGLLHDATEAYLSDVPAPFKHRLPDWQRFDNGVEFALRKHFGLPLHKTAYCKEADWLALFIEAKQLVNGEGADFADPLNLRDKALSLLANDRTLQWLFADSPLCHPARDANSFLAAYRHYASKAA